jgi:elongator complex protein 3
MANLYGGSVVKDKRDFKKLFSDPDFCPDELKIYPCSLIESGTDEILQKRFVEPYTHEQFWKSLLLL